MNKKVSIIIPSRNETFLAKTVEDIFIKAAGDIEVIVILDGYWPDPPLPNRDNLILVHRGQAMGMRAAISSGAAIAKGEYLMKSDGHCMFVEGYDEILKSDCDDNWIVIPRRFTLDVEQWIPRPSTSEKPHVDYEYFIFPNKYNPPALHGFRWNERTLSRSDILIDDTLTFQGSCWFMKKSHFYRYNFMTDYGYMGSHKQEAEELGLTTWTNNGRVIVNKKLWYAHMHKRRTNYHINMEDFKKCYLYSYQHWVKERKNQFIDVINKFMPIPGWPHDWMEKL